MKKGNAAHGRSVSRWLALAALVAAVGGGLAGCATPEQQQAAINDNVSAADEPEHRRRARIRLELAGSSFDASTTPRSDAASVTATKLSVLSSINATRALRSPSMRREKSDGIARMPLR